MSDRSLGYIVLFCLVLFLLAPTSFLIWKASVPVHTRIVEFKPFNGIEFLNIQDVVRCRGVVVGEVRTVSYQNQKIIVVIETSKPLSIYNGYKITATIKGLLGDRYIEIDPGKESSSGKVSLKDTLSGTFVSGAAEAVTYVEKFRDILHKFMTLSHELDKGNEMKISMVKKVNTMLTTIDSLSTTLLSVSRSIDSNVVDVFDTLKYYVDKGTSSYKQFSSRFPELLSGLKKNVARTDTLLKDVNQKLFSADTIFEGMNNPELEIWKNSLLQVQNDMDSLNQLFKDLENDGLNLPVRVRR